MSKPVSDLPGAVQAACRGLRAGLLRVLGDDLVGLWVYGAVTFADRPRRLGDVDAHAVVRSPIGPERARAIDELHASSDVEWDSWYVLLADAAAPAPPRHAFRAGLHDRAWALHHAPRRFRLFVAAFNHRAIRVYERAGFHATAQLSRMTNGGCYDFVEMTREEASEASP